MLPFCFLSYLYLSPVANNLFFFYIVSASGVDFSICLQKTLIYLSICPTKNWDALNSCAAVLFFYLSSEVLSSDEIV